jgi:hypothetical protein
MNLDFLNLNSVRNYPIRDGLSRISEDELFTIPNELILDLTISVPGDSHLKLYVSKLISTTDTVTIQISVKDGDLVGSFVVDIASDLYADTNLTASSYYPLAVGTITTGDLTKLNNLPSGEFTFSASNTELIMRAYTPASVGVNYISFTDNKGNSMKLTGDVAIIAESNLQFRRDGNSVYIDAGENLGLNKDCSETGVQIRKINGVSPDSEGNFYLIADDCVEINPIEYGVSLKDSCGKPCLGCNELGELTNRLMTTETDLLSLRDYINNLQNTITQLSTLTGYTCTCE